MPDRDQYGFPIIRPIDDSSKSIDSVLPERQEDAAGLTSATMDLSIFKGGRNTTSTTKKSFVDDIMERTAEKATAYDPTRGTVKSAADVPEFARDRYAMYYGSPTENLYGESQGTGQKLLYGIGRGISSGSRAFVQSTAGVLYDMGAALFTLDPNKFIDNDMNKAMSAWQKADENRFTLYETDAEKKKSGWDPSGWITGNHLAHLFETVGFMAGMAGGAYVTGIAGEALGGARISNSLFSSYKEAQAGLSEVSVNLAEISNIENGAELAAQYSTKLSREIEAIAAESIPNAAKLEKVNATINANKAEMAERFANKFTKFNKAKQTVYGAVGNLGIASAMGLDARESFKQNYIQSMKDKGVQLTDSQLAKLDETSKQVGNWVFGLTGALGAISFSHMLKGVVSKGEAEAAVREEINTLAQREILTDAEIAAGKVAKKIEGPHIEGKTEYYDPSKNVVDADTWIGKAGQRALGVAKVVKGYGGKIYDPWASLTMAEFSMAAPSVENYFTKKYETGDADVWEDAIQPNLENVFLTKEGLTEIVIGGLATAPFQIGGKIKSSRKRSENTDAAVSAIGSTYLGNYLKDLTESIKIGKSVEKDEVAAIKAGDTKGQYDARASKWQAYLFPRIKYDMKTEVDKDIQGYRLLASTEEGLKQLRNDGVIPVDGDINYHKTKLLEHLDMLQSYADNAEKTYKGLRLEFGGNKAFTDDHYQQLLYLSGMVDNASERIKTLSTELNNHPNISPQTKQDLIRLQQLMSKPASTRSELLDIKNSLQKGVSRDALKEKFKNTKAVEALKKKIVSEISALGSKDITSTKANELIRKVNDMVSLTNSKRDYLTDYHSITINPGKHKVDISSELPMDMEPQDDVIGPTIKLAHGNSNKVMASDGSIIYVPSDVEIGQEYIAGYKELPAEYNGALTTVKAFSKFRIEGEKYEGIDVNGKPYGRKIVISKEIGNKGERLYFNLDPETFKNYKLSKLKDLQKERNKEALFYVEHANDIFTYEFQKGKPEATKDGIILFDEKSKSLRFRYRGVDGKIYEIPLSLEEAKEGGRLKFKDSKKVISQEEYDMIRDFNDPQKAENLKNHTEIVKNVAKEHEESLVKIEERLKERNEYLKETLEEIKEFEKEFEEKTSEDFKVRGKFSKRAYSKFLNNTTKNISIYKDIVKDTLDDIASLEAQKEALQHGLEYIQKYVDKPELLRENAGIVTSELVARQEKHEKLIKSAENTITQLRTLMFNARNALYDAINTVRDMWRRFTNKYPDVADEVIVSTQGIDDYIDTEDSIRQSYFDPESLEFTEGLDERYDQIKQELKSIQDAIKAQEAVDVSVLQRDLDKAKANLEKYEENVKKGMAQLEAHKKLVEAFNKEYERWWKNDLLTRAFRDSPTVKSVLRIMQKSFNSKTDKAEPTSPDDPETKDALNNMPYLRMKGLERKPFADSIIVDTTNRDTELYKQHGNWPDREREFTANMTMHDFSPRNPKKFPIEGELDASKIGVIPINAEHQAAHGFANLVTDTYDPLDGSGTVYNKGENRNDARAAVALVYVYNDNGKYYTMDKQGNLLAEIDGTQQDLTNVVFTYLDTTSFKRTGSYKTGSDKFYDAIDFTEEELSAIEKSATAERKKLLDEPGLKFHDFDLMGGWINKEEPGATPKNRSFSEVGLISESDLDNADIVGVATNADPNNPKVALVENSDTKIPTGLSFVRLGRGNPVIASTKRFTRKEANNIYNIIKKIAKSMFEDYSNTRMDPEQGAMDRIKIMSKEESQEIRELRKYLGDISFFRKPSGDKLGRNRFYFNNEGELVIGKNPIKFDLQTIDTPETREKIITLIAGTDTIPGLFHNVNNETLRKEANDPWVEYVVDNDGNVRSRTWKSYRHYLLSDVDPNGAKRNANEGDNNIPLTINAKIPMAPGETAITGRYIKMRGYGESYNPKSKKTATQAPGAPSKAGMVPSIEKAKLFELKRLITSAEEITPENINNVFKTINKDEYFKWESELTDAEYENIMGEYEALKQAAISSGKTITPEVDTGLLAKAQMPKFIDQKMAKMPDFVPGKSADTKTTGSGIVLPIKVKDNDVNVELGVETTIDLGDYKHSFIATKVGDTVDVKLTKVQKLEDGEFVDFDLSSKEGKDLIDAVAGNLKGKLTEASKNMPSPKPPVPGVKKSLTIKVNDVDTNIELGSEQQISVGEFKHTFIATKVGDAIKVDIVNIEKLEDGEYAKVDLASDLGKEMIAKVSENLKNKLTEADKNVPDVSAVPSTAPDTGAGLPFPVDDVQVIDPKTGQNAAFLAAQQRAKNMKGGNRPNTRIIQPGEVKSFHEGEHKEFLDFLQRELPGITYTEANDVIRLTGGKFAWGIAKDDVITVYKGAPLKAKYHEAFHPVFDVFLTPREQADVIKEFRNREGTFFDLESGTYMKFSDATPYQVADALAEEWARFKVTGKVQKFLPKQQSFFRRLWTALTNLFKKPTTINQIFKKIDDGGFRDASPIQKPNIVNYSVGRELREKFSEITIASNVHGMAIEAVRNLRLDSGSFIKAVEGRVSFADIIDPVKNKFNKIFHGEDLEQGDYTILTDDSYSDVEKEQLFNNWTNVLEHWDDYMDEVKSFLKSRKLDFVPSKEVKSGADVAEDAKENAGENSNHKDYGADMLSIDAKNNSPVEIKLLFDFITQESFFGDKEYLNYNNPNLETDGLSAHISSTGMEVLANSDNYFYKTMAELSNSPSLAVMEQRFRALAAKHPPLVKIYKAIFGDPAAKGKAKNKEQLRLQMLFEKTFGKQSYTPLIQIIKEDGTSRTIDANSEKDANQIMNDFFSNMTGLHTKSNLVILDADANYTFNPEAMINPQSPDYIPNPQTAGIPENKEKAALNFLNKIGYTFPEEIFKKLDKSQKEKLVDASVRLYQEIGTVRSKGSYITRSSLTSNAINEIANLYVAADGAFRASQYLSVSNEPKQRYVQHNAYSKTLSIINNSQSLEDLYQKKPYYETDPFVQNSILLKPDGLWFKSTNKDGVTKWKDNVKMKVTVTEGLDSEGKGIETHKMNLIARFMQGFNMNAAGNFYTVAPADSAREWGGQNGENALYYVSPTMFNSTVGRKHINDIFKGYLAAEIETIKDFNEGDSQRSLLDQLNKKVGNTKIGQQLRFFKDILSKESGTVARVEEYANGKGPDANLTTKEFLDKMEPIIGAELEQFFRKTVADHRNFLEESKVIGRGSKQGFTWAGLNEEIGKRLKVGREEKATAENRGENLKMVYDNEEIDKIIRFRTVNHLIHGIEIHKLIIGDPAIYKDAFKRIKLFMSGKDFTHIDGPTGTTNMLLNDSYNYVGDHKLEQGQTGYHNFMDSFSILTYNWGDGADTKVASSSWSKMPEKYQKAYQENNPVDAQSHTLLSFYREHKIKEGTWPEGREAQYQYDEALFRKEATERFKAGETKFEKFAYKDTDADKALEQESNKILAQGNPSVVNAFHVDKPLGVGMYDVNGEMIPFMLKTSSLALSWDMVRGKTLEDLYLKMKENNVGYVGPKSQQKVGGLYEAPPLYDVNTGKLSLSNEQFAQFKMPVSWQDWGKIVETSGEKTKITLGSQVTKLDTLGLFARGIPKDFMPGKPFAERKKAWNDPNTDKNQSKFYQLYKKKNEALEALTFKGFDEMVDSIGITGEKGNYELVDASKLTDFLNNEITRRELPQNMKDALDVWYNPDSNRIELTNALETLSNFNQIRSIINSLVDKKISAPKVNGRSLILVSSTGFEDVANGLRKEKIGNKYVLVSDRLKFYEPKQDGSTSRMQVMMTNFMAEELKKKSNLSDAELMKYLMSEEGKELLYGVGFRIPTQGINFIDSFEIVPFDLKYTANGEIDYENSRMFVPATYGEVVVVPAELSTKAGSDFDVDKLNSYLKNFYIDKEGYPRAVKFLDDTNSTAEERYVKYVNENNKNKGDYNELKNLPEYSKMDRMFEKTLDQSQELYEEGKQEKANYREQIKKFEEENMDIYNQGRYVFSKLPTRIKEEFWQMEDAFREEGIKGIMKIQEYHTFTNDYIDAIKLDVAAGKDKKNNAEILPLLEKMAEVSGIVLENNGVKKQYIEDYKKFRDELKQHVKDKQAFIFTELKQKQKAAYKEWLFKASQIIAEARGIEPFEKFSKKNISYQNSIEAIENMYQQNIHDIITLPSNFENLVAPNSAQEMKDFMTKIDTLKNRDKSKSQKQKIADQEAKKAMGDISYIDTIDPLKVTEIRQVMLDGKNQVGIAAQANTGNSLSQSSQLPLFIDPTVRLSNADKKLIPLRPDGNLDFSIKFDHNTTDVNGDIVSTLSGGEVDNNYISNIISQIIDGAVDAANDPWLMKLFPSKEALSTGVLLTRAGVNMNDIVLFMHQPILMELFAEERKIKAIRLLDPTNRTSNEDIIKIASARFNSKDTYYSESNFKQSDLENMIAKYNAGQSLTASENAYQKFVLAEYKKYKLFADHALQIQMATGWDNIDNPSRASIYLKNKTMRETQEGNVFGNANNLIKGTFIETRREKLMESDEVMSKIYKNVMPYIEPIWEALASKKLFLSPDDKRAMMDGVVNSFMDFLAQNFHTINGNRMGDYVKKAFLSDDFAKILYNAKRLNETKKDTGEYNLALSMLRLQRPVYSKDTRNITLITKPKDKPTSDSLTESFRELKATHPGIYNNLVVIGHLQSGTTDSRLSFNKYLPAQDYMVPLKDGIRALDAGNEMLKAFIETNQYYKNNWNNDDLAPAMSQRNAFTKASLRNEVIRIEEGKYGSSNPIVKIKSRINPETGRRFDTEHELNLTKKGFKFKRSIKLFRRVEDAQGNPYIVSDKNKSGETVNYYIYKQINALGDGSNLQEYRLDNGPSQRDMHFKIIEDTDAAVMDAFEDKTETDQIDSTIISTTPIVQKGITVKPNAKGEYNIYAGTGENTVLSNFAVRPFEYNTKIFPRETVKFQSVEQAFQFMKLAYSQSSVKNQSIANKILETTDGKTLRNLGKSFDMKKDDSWNTNSSRIMKELLLKSFEQNPEALKELLATGDAKLTHTQDTGKWGTEFPRILMEVRNELKKSTTGEGKKPNSQVGTLTQVDNARSLNNSLRDELRKGPCQL